MKLVIVMPLSVEKIENGTVIDHIDAGLGLKVLGMLGIDRDFGARVAVIMNVPSKKLGKKDIVKIEGVALDSRKSDLVSLVCKNATINIIKKSELAEKRQARLPKKVSGVLRCPNARCITNSESMETEFELDGEGMRCAFCEKKFPASELV